MKLYAKYKVFIEVEWYIFKFFIESKDLTNRR